ncbi:uncharacterized protein LOC113463336 [Phoenix dactylifera]|uniref:Uncharacterized protein LOC113463336 n=1 Tax=Phoenix dactylifera TaxID=42345 RepID=A0A8B9AVA4_PHODC|nr:uncharacterized protein LOC113463336 [Phoenix dactylifera]
MRLAVEIFCGTGFFLAKLKTLLNTEGESPRCRPNPIAALPIVPFFKILIVFHSSILIVLLTPDLLFCRSASVFTDRSPARSSPPPPRHPPAAEPPVPTLISRNLLASLPSPESLTPVFFTSARCTFCILGVLESRRLRLRPLLQLHPSVSGTASHRQASLNEFALGPQMHWAALIFILPLVI